MEGGGGGLHGATLGKKSTQKKKSNGLVHFLKLLNGSVKSVLGQTAPVRSFVKTCTILTFPPESEESRLPPAALITLTLSANAATAA